MKEGLAYYDFLLRIYWLHTLFFLAYRRTLSLPIPTWLSLSSKVGRNYSYRLPISQGPSEQLDFRKGSGGGEGKSKSGCARGQYD